MSANLNLFYNKQNTKKIQNITVNKNNKFNTNNCIYLPTEYKNNDTLNSNAKSQELKSDNDSVTNLSNNEQIAIIITLGIGFAIGALIGFIFGSFLGSEKNIVTEENDLKFFSGKNLELHQAINASKDVIPLYSLHSKSWKQFSTITPITTILGGVIFCALSTSFVYSGTVIYNSII